MIFSYFPCCFIAQDITYAGMFHGHLQKNVYYVVSGYSILEILITLCQLMVLSSYISLLMFLSIVERGVLIFLTRIVHLSISSFISITFASDIFCGLVFLMHYIQNCYLWCIDFSPPIYTFHASDNFLYSDVCSISY